MGVDDKRLIPEFVKQGDTVFWTERESERDWHYCKYCYRDVPTFLFREGFFGNPPEHIQTLRCCWECGAGLDTLYHK